LLQVFMAVATIVGIAVGAAVTQREYADARVRAWNDDLEQRVRVRTADLQAAHDDTRISEGRLADAQGVAHIGSWEWRVPENRVWWSRELYRIAGVDREGFDGTYQAFLTVVHPDDRARLDRIVRGSLQDQEPFELEHRIIRADGGVRILYVKGRVVQFDRGQPVRMLGIAQDITERKRLEAELLQAQKRETLGRLVSAVAHDFNNVLTVIRGYTDLVLAEVEEASPHRADLLEVRKAAGRAAALTRQLLMFSQRQALEPQDISLNTVIDAIGPMLRQVIGDNIVMTAALAPDLRAVKTDVSHVEQILMNLIVNARDAMAAGGRLTLETKNVTLDGQYGLSKPVHPPAGEYVLLAVSDTGLGMDDRVKSHLFEPFFTTKEPGQGTGLGLATVYNIVKRSGGYIWVYSEPKRGTTFKLYFPTDGVPPPPAALASEEILADVPTGAETVLLVEDDEDVRRVARTALRKQGYRVLEAPTGDEARRVAAGCPDRIDLVLTDVVMPGLDGPALVAHLRIARPALKALLISGYTERAIVQEGVIPPATPFLEKPFTPAELLRKTRAVLDVET
jgi:PAS domain S-box-containing protein